MTTRRIKGGGRIGRATKQSVAPGRTTGNRQGLRGNRGVDWVRKEVLRVRRLNETNSMERDERTSVPDVGDRTASIQLPGKNVRGHYRDLQALRPS